MKRVLNWFLSIGLAIVMCFGVTVVSNSATAEFAVAGAATDYYASITATNGNSLLGQVHDLITTTHKTYTSYADCKNPTYVKKTDPGTGGALMEFYSQADLSSTWQSGAVGTWNREHVWCQSLSNGLWGESGGGADMHHIRPTESRLNSTRGNNKYGVVSVKTAAYYKDASGNSTLAGYNSGGVFEPLDNVKGDVARIVMYVYTHYNTYSNVYGTTNGSGNYFGTLKFTNIMSASNESAAISMLLQWHESDPVDQIEITRNEAVYSIQGNRNPFIDHPEYADAIWGGGTLNPGGGTDTPDPSVELKSLSVSPATLNLYVGRSQTLTVTANPSNANASVSWTSSNASIATVSSSGEVTAKAEGTATITATSTENSSIKATAKVTVEKSNTTSITITRDSFSASGSYGFHTWSEDGVSGIAYIYGGESGMMQFNSSKSSQYLASTTAAPGAIKSVTAKLNSKTNGGKDWKLLTSNSPYGEVDKAPTNGNDQGTKTVTTSGVTWTVSGNDTYFALTYQSTNACYVDSIIVEFGESGGTEKHECQHVCPTCSKCTDKNCKDPVCANKCQGHVVEPEHECNHVCPTCSKCTDKNCNDPVCASKCQGHVVEPEHECKHVCPTCGKCTDKNCKDPVCADKCQGHEIVPEHECNHVCPACSKCTDKNCKDSVCADKCQGHVVDPEHECKHVCPTCCKCTDKNCKDPVCADKCQGHETVPEHECNHVCPTCSKCTDKNCKDSVCADKCQGHVVEPEHECNHVCPTCGKCTDETCTDEVCADKCHGHGGSEEDTRLQEFHYAVSKIVTKGTLDERLASINKAIRAYQALTAEQKALAADDVATLQQAISDYNKTVNSFNQDAEAANDAATGKSKRG